MAISVSLTDIIETLEMQLDEASSFVDTETGEVGLPAWQRDELKVVQRMASVGGFLKLPSKWDVHEWEIMQEFALQVESASARE